MQAFGTLKPSRLNRKNQRRQERGVVRGAVYRCFCEGREIHKDLLLKAKEIDIFAGQKPMNEEEAVALVIASSDLSRKEQRKNRRLFQAWFLVGSRRFWDLINNFRIGKEVIYEGTTNLRREIPGFFFHQTARRCGEKRYVTSFRKYPPCLRC